MELLKTPSYACKSLTYCISSRGSVGKVNGEEEEQRQRGYRGKTGTDRNSETRSSLPLVL